ncbi:MAG: hypothetical protein MRY64_13070 [Hyphomonadaceae bacterium]|nr:hypothetical protein [Hyphomonadaceae bacterium]
MADVVVKLGLKRPGDDLRLANAIETYARWRAHMCDVEVRQPEEEAPDIMVKTGYQVDGGVLKTLIFQERRWAAAFLQIWRSERKRVLEA